MLLNKNWKLIYQNRTLPCKTFPVSMYRTLMANGKIDDPYYGENQYAARELSREDCEFFCEFVPETDLFSEDKIYLRFFGIDTLSEVFLNDRSLFKTDNMFATYECEVQSLLKKGINRLSVRISSPLRFAEEAFKARPLYGVEGTVPGYQHIRKAHYSFGWDWGPQLPDMGIWRNVEIIGKSLCEIKSISFKQDFSDDLSSLTLTVAPEVNLLGVRPLELLTEIALSDGRSLISRKPIHQSESTEFKIENPPLWNVRGMGKQPLQTVTLTVFDGEKAVDTHTEKIGFRKLTVNNDSETGKFCFVCNNKEIFAMGANIIPGDQILPFITEERTNAMLNRCADAGFNCLRIWGGGFYPDDCFLSKCDEMGFILWQDFMFACAAYRLTGSLTASIKKELTDNIIRLRNHPCLGLWCGNNEIESMWEGWGVPEDKEAQSDYVELFEKTIPKLLKKLDPDAFYWPSSPSSGGSQFGGKCFNGSSDKNRGDQHFWAVWHNFAPLEEFRKNDFPFCSEFGFESIPSIKTVSTFAKGKDLNLSSPVMEAHQKCALGNEKLLFYIAQMCRCPKSFEETIYATQLVQAESIRLNVEHMRRKRGKCMGSLYWQFNDSNPVISWSAMDSFGRPKALYYATKRFYSPILLSCLEEDAEAVQFHITNDTPRSVSGKIWWQLRRNDGEAIKSGSSDFESLPLSAAKILSVNLSRELKTAENKRSCFLQYEATVNGKTVSEGCTIFVRPKSFNFLPPDFSLTVDETPSSFILTLKSRNFAKGVMLDLKDADCIFSDNFFDLCGKRVVEIKKDTLTLPLTAATLRKRLTVISCYDLQVTSERL